MKTSHMILTISRDFKFKNLRFSMQVTPILSKATQLMFIDMFVNHMPIINGYNLY